MPSDGQRIKMVKLLVDHGYQQRIMLAHDIHTKHRLVSNCHGNIITTLLVGEIWWPWIQSHTKQHCTQDGRQRYRQRNSDVNING